MFCSWGAIESFFWPVQHTYLSYGPLLCGATNVIYEGVPSYPSPARCWEIVEKYKVGFPSSDVT